MYYQTRRKETTMKNCAICKGALLQVEDIVNEIERYFFVVKGARCTFCGEEYLDEHEGQKMIICAKILGVW